LWATNELRDLIPQFHFLFRVEAQFSTTVIGGGSSEDSPDTADSGRGMMKCCPSGVTAYLW
jgi:hypothetical protein